ncbi:MarR family winged helix-turn-helix transcriptional regulator [Rhodoplanes sp. Z2-YC6860]|uniref:MarR family winged helix-turn-helix transcriptional regulator n=1 Tax=Rhodoplanes sp. Z2-YC6860 TaxID=674703 RepID=UPI00078BCE7F|nr:MarR family transcriptional regulator [Rhodoplanes sp. Z2-YC6860]AMN42626.1 MarR family transcriptional regulator [Rhodoplanes sp. Z2-YC6860]
MAMAGTRESRSKSSAWRLSLIDWQGKHAMAAADLDNDPLILLYDVARHMRTCADQMAQAHGLTRAQIIILARLEQQPDVSQNELAACAEVAPITIARLIDRLEELSLVKRCPDPEDRRIWRLRLTPAAAPILREIKSLRTKLRGVMTKGIDPAILEAMTTGLRQIKENVTSRRFAKASA